jgi:hypothetical protein
LGAELTPRIRRLVLGSATAAAHLQHRATNVIVSEFGGDALAATTATLDTPLDAEEYWCCLYQYQR